MPMIAMPDGREVIDNCVPGLIDTIIARHHLRPDAVQTVAVGPSDFEAMVRGCSSDAPPSRNLETGWVSCCYGGMAVQRVRDLPDRMAVVVTRDGRVYAAAEPESWRQPSSPFLCEACGTELENSAAAAIRRLR